VSPIPLEYEFNGPKRSVAFRLRSEEDLELLRNVFRSLATGSANEINLVHEKIVTAVDDFWEFKLRLIPVEKTVKPWVRKLDSGEKEHGVLWRRDKEGWTECAELLESLTPGTHQYFNYGVFSEVDIAAYFNVK